MTKEEKVWLVIRYGSGWGVDSVYTTSEAAHARKDELRAKGTGAVVEFSILDAPSQWDSMEIVSMKKVQD